MEIVLHPQHRAIMRKQRQSAAASDSAVISGMAASNVSATARGLFIAVLLPLRGGRASLFAGAQDGCRPDPVLIAALRKAQAMVERDDHGRAIIGTARYRPTIARSSASPSSLPTSSVISSPGTSHSA